MRKGRYELESAITFVDGFALRAQDGRSLALCRAAPTAHCWGRVGRWAGGRIRDRRDRTRSATLMPIGLTYLRRRASSPRDSCDLTTL